MYLYEITRINLKFCFQRRLENESSPEKKVGQLLKKKKKMKVWILVDSHSGESFWTISRLVCNDFAPRLLHAFPLPAN